MSHYYSNKELRVLGFSSIGINVCISRDARFYGEFTVGDNVRVDDFCILTGTINIGSYVHIGAHTCLYGSGGISMGDYSTCSGRVNIYSASDDFSGNYMISPLVPPKLTRVTRKKIIMRRFSIVGTGSTLLPGAVLGEGTAVGAMSLVKCALLPWSVYAGIPVRFISKRSDKMKSRVLCQ